ncbi:MAG: hypothetical protein QM731_20350 [Chitinophagaceae bacterium]
MPVKILIAVLLSMLILKAKTSSETAAANNRQQVIENKQTGSTTLSKVRGMQTEETDLTFYNRNLEIYSNIAAQPVKMIVKQ